MAMWSRGGKIAETVHGRHASKPGAPRASRGKTYLSEPIPREVLFVIRGGRHRVPASPRTRVSAPRARLGNDARGPLTERKNRFSAARSKSNDDGRSFRGKATTFRLLSRLLVVVSTQGARGGGHRARAMSQKRKRCSHGRRKSDCVDCNPCPHGKLKRRCVDCTPCPHSKLKESCADCSGCPHSKQKHNCAACKACPHGKRKDICADCNPCPHGKLKSRCVDCTPCPHSKLKRDCAACNPCPHGKHKYKCATCKAAREGKSAPPEIKPDPEIKLEPEIKPEPEIKQEPFTIRGYFGIGD